jgi:hypothetical protein
MIRKLIYIIILIIICSCNQSTDKKENIDQTEKIQSDPSTDELSNIITFDYNKFEIKKGNLGEIKIGMTISEAEQKFEGLRKEIGEATSFGFGGGSPAYLYYDKDDLLFGLISALDTNTILFIIVASPKFKTTNGLNPNSKVKEISKQYPKAKVYQNLMNSWEEISDTINNWNFIFMTDEKTVGEYHKLENPSELKNMNIKADWITIK